MNMLSAVQPAWLSNAGAGLVQWLVMTVLVLPWLNPFEPGPAEAMVQGLLSLLALGVWLLLPWRAEGPGAMARVLAASWLVAALLSTGLALLQYTGNASQWAPWVSQSPLGTVYANLRQRNHFASLISLGLVALIWLAARSGKPEAPPPRAWVLAAAWLGLGNGLSSSRTGLLEMVLLLGLFGLLWRRSQAPGLPRLLMAAVVGYAVAVLVLPWLGSTDSGLVARLQTEPWACASRSALWSNVLYLIGQQPLTGWGWGGLIYAQFITLFPGLRFCGLMDNAHNAPLHLAVEFGVPAAVLVCRSMTSFSTFDASSSTTSKSPGLPLPPSSSAVLLSSSSSSEFSPSTWPRRRRTTGARALGPDKGIALCQPRSPMGNSRGYCIGM